VSDVASLDCPCCGEDAFVRAESWFGEDEQERCSDCGCLLIVRVEGYGDEDDPCNAYASVLDDGGCSR
jgi:hypothetical protein